jgi:hypothetical protein
MSWTERYLAAALRSIPGAKRADVERELRSSIDDAIEERVAAGDDRTAAERVVLEGLGDPAQLASGYTGKPNYLIGPELFPFYRRIIPRLLAGAAPLPGIIIGIVTLADGASFNDALAAGIGATITIAIQIAFWGTAAFAFLERADAGRQAKEELLAKAGGRWTLERLPEPSRARSSVGEVANELVAVLLTLGGLLFAGGLATTDAAGTRIPLLVPAVTDVWLPILIGALASLAILHVAVYAAGRWTMAFAAVYAAIQLVWAVPIVWLAINDTLINPAFGVQIGWPALAEDNGIVVLSIAVVTVLVTGWEIFQAFRKARAGAGATPLLGATGQVL